jgi:hypothetical protein
MAFLPMGVKLDIIERIIRHFSLKIAWIRQDGWSETQPIIPRPLPYLPCRIGWSETRDSPRIRDLPADERTVIPIEATILPFEDLSAHDYL